ncbi:hypothetical protein V1281_005506 [Nitrobacteraceae bacterium AZCC 2161]
MAERTRKLGPRVTVSMAPDDYKTLNSLADMEDVSVSWVVRRAIQEYLRAHSGKVLVPHHEHSTTIERA